MYLHVEQVQLWSLMDQGIKDENGIEQELKGVEFLRNLYNEPSAVWKQTSYNTYGNQHLTGGTPFRGNYASAGYKYDADADVFYLPYIGGPDGTIFNSWILNNNTYLWEPPTPCPLTYDQGHTNDNGDPSPDWYKWNESTTSWDLLPV